MSRTNRMRVPTASLRPSTLRPSGSTATRSSSWQLSRTWSSSASCPASSNGSSLCTTCRSPRAPLGPRSETGLSIQYIPFSYDIFLILLLWTIVLHHRGSGKLRHRKRGEKQLQDGAPIKSATFSDGLYEAEAVETSVSTSDTSLWTTRIALGIRLYCILVCILVRRTL